MGRTPLRAVSALLMSVLFTVPVLGAVCGMPCEPGARHAHRSHGGDSRQIAAGSQASGHHHGHASSVDATAAHQHAASPATVSDAPRPSVHVGGRCCDQPTLTLTAIPVVRHELPINPAALDIVSLVSSGSDVRQANVRRDASRAPSPPRPSNPVLRI